MHESVCKSKSLAFSRSKDHVAFWIFVLHSKLDYFVHLKRESKISPILITRIFISFPVHSIEFKFDNKTQSSQRKDETTKETFCSDFHGNTLETLLFEKSNSLLLFQVIPLLSLSIMIVGVLHLGDCPIQPLLPIWHIVAGSSGLCTPFFYLLFDNVNPWLSRRFPAISELLDNVVVCLLPLYIIFEVAWLITGTFWVVGTDGVQEPEQCNHTVYIFSYVVVVNFW